MVQNLERVRQTSKFPETAPAGYQVFFRTYSRRRFSGERETWDGMRSQPQGTYSRQTYLTSCTNRQDAAPVEVSPSGRWLWVELSGFSDENFSGAYNCRVPM